jgi:hypothetical protein
MRRMGEDHVGKTSHIRMPDGPIPVVATIRGQRIQIGTGTIDGATGVFTTTFNDSPEAAELLRALRDSRSYSLPVRLAGVEALPGVLG